MWRGSRTRRSPRSSTSRSARSCPGSIAEEEGSNARCTSSASTEGGLEIEMADHGHEEAGEEHDHGQHRHGQHVMDCEEVLHRLYHFLDGEVAAADRGTIQQHLDACMACLEAFEFEAEFKVIVATKCKEQA